MQSLVVISSWLFFFLILQSERLHKVLGFVSTVHDLCAVLGMDFLTTVTEVHPSLNDSRSTQLKSISNDTLTRLADTVLTLKEDKRTRLDKVIMCSVNFVWSLFKKHNLVLFLLKNLNLQF